MQLLASCSLEESLGFDGKLVLPNEDKSNPDKVMLNVVVTDGDKDVFTKLNGKQKCVTFVGKPTTFCPPTLKGNVFNETTIDALESPDFPRDVEGVITLVRLPNDYSDMRTVKDICTKYPNIRVIGGRLLNIEGVRIGRYDIGKDKLSVYDGFYDTFAEANLNDLDGIQEVVTKTRKKIESGGLDKPKKSKAKSGKSTTSKEPKEKKPPKRAVAFSNLFGSNEVEF